MIDTETPTDGQAPEAQAAPPSPTPGPVHSKLARLQGRWQGTEKISPTPMLPNGATATGTVENELAFNGMGVIHNYHQVREGSDEPFRGHGVFQVLPNSETVVLTWFDQMGRFEFLGQFQGDDLMMECRLPDGLSRCAYRLGEGAYRFVMSMSQDGQTWMPFIDGTYKRVE